MKIDNKLKEYQEKVVEEYRDTHPDETEHLTDEEVALMSPLTNVDIGIVYYMAMSEIKEKIAYLEEDIEYSQNKLNDSKTFYEEKTELRQDINQARKKIATLRKEYEEYLEEYNNEIGKSR